MALQESRFLVLWEKLLEVSEVRIFLATFHYNALFSRRATIHERNLKTIKIITNLFVLSCSFFFETNLNSIGM